MFCWHLRANFLNDIRILVNTLSNLRNNRRSITAYQAQWIGPLVNIFLPAQSLWRTMAWSLQASLLLQRLP